MAEAYSFEVRERAEDLYVVEGKTFEQVSDLTGVSLSQLKRWSAEAVTPWPEGRREYVRAMGSIRKNSMLAKARMVEEVVKTLDPQKAYAFASLMAATKAMQGDGDMGPVGARHALPTQPMGTDLKSVPAREIHTPAETIAALEEAVQNRINRMLLTPEALSFKAIQEMGKALELLDKMRAEHIGIEQAGGERKTLDAETIKALREQVGL